MAEVSRHSIIRSQEINYLIFRYLQESGYTHTAYTFALESQIDDNIRINTREIPPGTLLSFLQRGVHLLEAEESAFGDDAPNQNTDDAPLSLLELHRYMSDPEGMRANLEARRSHRKHAREVSPAINGVKVERDELLTLKGHSENIYGCDWNARNGALASASRDSTVRIWSIPDRFPAPSTDHEHTILEESLVLRHDNTATREMESSMKMKKRRNEVFALGWNPGGTLLATGSQDGEVSLWNTSGQLVHKCAVHKEPVFALKWNPSGTHFVTGSVDSTVGVWKGNGKCVKKYPFHSGPVVDIDWSDDEIFATCSSDANIHLCSIDANIPLMTFKGHEGEINMVRVSPFGSVLASGGDDKTVRLWCSESSREMHTFREHQREVYTLDWCPTARSGPALATGSFDATVKLWDLNKGRCVSTLVDNTSAIYSVKYSTDGRFLASGSMNGSLIIWSMKDNFVVKKFVGVSPIQVLAWNHEGNKLAACFENGDVCVLDLRKLVYS